MVFKILFQGTQEHPAMSHNTMPLGALSSEENLPISRLRLEKRQVHYALHA